MEIFRTAISRFKKDCGVIAGREIPEPKDAIYKEYKLAEKMEKKLVHCYYLSRK